MRYRDYWIELNKKPIPSRAHDWDWWHDGYDGPGDPRSGASPDIGTAMRDVDENIREYGDWDEGPSDNAA